MIIRLSAQQWAACVQHGTDRHLTYLQRFVQQSQNWRLVNMPAAGLQALIGEFEKVVFTPKWGKRKAKVPERSLRALRTLATTLNTWTTHPAFNDGAMPGKRFDVLAAWRRRDHGWSPFPLDEVDSSRWFTLLVPDVQPWRVAGDEMLITRWTPGQVTHCEIEVIDEAEHLNW